MSWSAAVLCGGRSRRMGRDKALLEVGGEALVARVVRAASEAGAAEVVVVGGDRDGLAAVLPGTTIVDDDFPGEGPLGGVLTALAALATTRPHDEALLVLACDLLAPSAATMAATVSALADRPDAALAAPQRGARTEWLHAAWRGDVGTRLAERFAAGERSIHGAVADAGLTLVPVRGLAAATLADADVPGDLPPRD